MESLPYSGTSKRAKAPAGNITQTAHCLVDGCTADLNLCRDYHRRHKVCEAHSKTPLVKIGGREQRFCQQCSRFHSLGEFDEGKRSCRKRLDGHNRRRRKPQTDSLARAAPPGLVFSAQQSMSTARLLSFTAPQMLPTATSVVGNSWPGIVKPEHEMSMSLYTNHHPHQQLNYVERPSQFGDHSFHEHSFVDPTNVMSGSSGSNRNRALSLLSSSAPTSTRDFVLNHVVAVQTGTESVYPPQPHQHALPHNYYGGSSTTTGLGQFAAYFQDSKPAASASDSHGSNTSTLHFPEMFQQAPDGSSTGGSHQTLTFTWE